MQISYEINDIERELLAFKPKRLGFVWVHVVLSLVGLYGGILMSFWGVYHLPFMLILTIPITSIFMCRSYVLLHDCGHMSLFRSPFLNHAIGHILGFGILIPHSLWRYIHDAHHKNVGNLEQRAFNPEIWTMTLREYQASGPFKRAAYRFMRSKWTRFTITPTINLGLIFRLVSRKFNTAANVSVLIHDVAYILIVLFLVKFHAFSVLLVVIYLPLVLFYFVASFTFYAQHQFENTYWENEHDWDYQKASFLGASCIEAPRWFRFLTGNIVYHNLHHLQAGIPFYQLHKAHELLKQKYSYPCYTLRDVWKMLDFKVWDEEKKRLVTYPN